MRKLSNFMPLKAHRLPPQDFAWNALADMLDGWADICKVSAVTSLTTWKIAGDLLGDLRFSVLLRSRFFSLTNAFLKSNLLGWLIGRFSLETVGVEYASLSAAAEHTVAFPLLNIERKLSRVRNNTPFFPRITQ